MQQALNVNSGAGEGPQHESSPLERFRSRLVTSFAPPRLDIDDAAREFTLEDLQSSWLLSLVKLFNAWSFLVATVVIAGYGANTFLNMFLEFSTGLASEKRILHASIHMWLQITGLIVQAGLFILIFAGLIQRGVWLVRDSMEFDMFICYRRTLCCEGTGPGTFRRCRREIHLETPEDVDRVQHAIGYKSAALARDLDINGVRLFKGSELLAVGPMANANSCSNLQELELPASVIFRADTRPAEFNRTCASWDVIFQCLIFFSLDVMPVIFACTELNFLVRFSEAWFNKFAIAAVWVSVYHIGIYFVWSTFLEYYWKQKAFRKMVQNFGLCCSARQAREGSLPEVTSIMARNVLEEDVESLLGSPLGAHGLRPRTPQSSSVNICVWFRNMLARQRFAGYAFLVGAVGCLAVCVVFGVQCQLGKMMLAVGLLCMAVVIFRMRASLGGRGKHAVRVFASVLQGGAHNSVGIWALWFRVTCSVEPVNSCCVEFVILLISLFMIVFGIWQKAAIFTLLTALLAIWCINIIFVSVAFSNYLWIFIVAQNAVFCLAALTRSVSTRGYGAGCGGCLLLIFLSQMGMWRQREKHTHVVSTIFFTIIVLAIATTTLLASLTNTGFAFGNPRLEWCHDEPNCSEFQYPLHGTQRSYDFCGLSWPMGPNISGADEVGTVSDQCNDTKLNVVDFGQIATVAGYLPNLTKVNLTIEKYLPGWTTVYSQAYNTSNGNFTSFIHLMRGTTGVIAVRGTSSAVEILEDFNIWLPVGFLQLLTKLGPSMISIRSLLLMLTRGKTAYRQRPFQQLVSYTQRLLDSYQTPQRLYITGHSLGGGIATAIGAIFDIPAITFSAPGMKATSAILNPVPKLDSLIYQSVNVMPYIDVIPMVDNQAGTMLQIRCPANNPFKCHRLTSTMCELLASCGDGGGRDVPRGYNRACRTCQPTGQALAEFCG